MAKLKDRIEEVQPSVNKVLEYSQNQVFVNLDHGPQTDALMELWAKNKNLIYKLLNEQLIYETEEEVTFELDTESQKDSYLKFTHRATHVNGASDSLYDFLAWLNPQYFFENRVPSNWESCSWKDDDIKIPAGMRVSKALSKFFAEDDEYHVREIQDMASEFMQMNKIKGKLCLSIHPLDYLSCSENTLGWRSCHALDGEYRGGTLAYMTDKSTIVCYIKASSNANLIRFPNDVPWNNKKWRVLLHIDLGKNTESMGSSATGTICVGRQYPFAFEGGIEKVKDIIQDRFNALIQPFCDCEYSSWNNALIESLSGYDLNSQHRYVNKAFFPFQACISSPARPIFYNDLLLSPYFKTPYMAYPVGYNNGRMPIFRVGQSSVPCIACGKEKISYCDELVCKDCFKNVSDDEVYYCDCCGERIPRDDPWSWSGNDVICSACQERYYSICPHCGMLARTEDLGEGHCTHCPSPRIVDEFINAVEAGEVEVGFDESIFDNFVPIPLPDYQQTEIDLEPLNAAAQAIGASAAQTVTALDEALASVRAVIDEEMRRGLFQGGA